MTKTKIILGLTTILGILALTTTAATANFTAVTAGRTSGSSQLKTGNTATLSVDPSAAAFTSSKAPDTWRIQDTKSEQRVTKEGGHLDQTIEFQEIRAAVPVTVNNPVVVQFVRITPTTSDVLISKPVVIRIFLSETAICTVHIEPVGANRQLTKVKDTNIESKSLEAIAEITNIHSISEGAEACKLAGVEPEPTTGTFNATSIEHGVIQRTP